ncbi:PAS domain-containing protein, partial [Candidatus Poribacteria bacterium]|nr:PAS domain-containing protein [Candidatus Poribacteria bacterium]
VWAVKLDGSGFLYLSKSIEDIYGITLEEFQNNPLAWLDAVHPEDKERVEKESELLHEKGVIETEYRIIQSDGEMRWLHDRKYIINDDEGNPTMIGGIASDITDRVKAENALKQSYEDMEDRVQERTTELTELNVKLQRQQERFLAVFNSFPEVMYVADMETYEVLMVNKAFAKLLGKDPTGGICYKEFQGFDSPCDFCTNRIIKEQKGKVYNWEYHNPILNKDFLISDKIIKWPDGRDVRFELAIDVTEYKKSEKELKQRAEALARSNAELERFAYVASHDLQEPLRKIQAFGNRLMIKYSNDLDEKGADYIRRMQNAANRMQDLISDLLAFSRINTRAKPFQSVNMKSVMEKVVGTIEPILKKSNGTIEVGDIPDIEGDFNQIVQLMKNLIDNSIKFHKESVPPHVEISSFIEGDMCWIEVQDNGIGFDEKYLDRIFTIFQRLHGRFEYEGTGVGLAICRRIVERHNGTITAKSSPGEGSTFIVKLPLSQEVE